MPTLVLSPSPGAETGGGGWEGGTGKWWLQTGRERGKEQQRKVLRLSGRSWAHARERRPSPSPLLHLRPLGFFGLFPPCCLVSARAIGVPPRTSRMLTLLLTNSKYKKNMKCCLVRLELQMISFYCSHLSFLFQSAGRIFPPPEFSSPDFVRPFTLGCKLFHDHVFILNACYIP